MVENPVKTPVADEDPKSKDDPDKAADGSSEPVAVDRAGLDLGGSTGKTSAGTGLGLGRDAADSRRDRRLPGRRGKRT